ncbi:hypothetical protein [Methylobacterium thuringiense]|uniref:Uncharacterized protein n=1 Tax=Methylobacterium thuringiense TaxID=1003091 RepID=A0ABQ4TKW4_9HYPH|nr:hypothetical protein [Methylobacterium thuringiense]GJE55263.1 hypothetical protein EKPJFOCH_1752 [Methylobacterium thuringiense]
MSQELPPVTLVTPTETATVTTVIQKSWWGRIFDLFAILGAFALALLQSIGEINFGSLGFTPTQAAWAGVILFAVRFALAYRPVTVLDTKVQPGPGERN